MGAAEAPEPSSAQGYLVASSKSAALRVVGHAPSAPAARPPFEDREAWVALFRTVRDETERRAAPLSPEDQVVQSMPDASPTKWHRAHTTWFFEQFVLRPHLPGYEPFDPRFAYLFNSYYVAAGPRHDRPKRGLLTRPTCNDGAGFCFDNEGPRHEVLLQDAHIGRGLVRNRDWLGFMAEGGYGDPALWL